MQLSENSGELKKSNSNSLLIRAFLRIFSWFTVGLTLLFLFNNYLIFWRGWPGLWVFFAHQKWFGIPSLRTPLSENAQTQGWIQILVLVSLLMVIILVVFKTPKRTLSEDAKIFTELAAYISRSCFWAVLIVGFVDMLISFLRVEDLLIPLIGNKMAIELGRSIFRGTYVHYPLVIFSFFIAFFIRGLGFTWLSLLVVIAEFQIVISRFVYSYEQAFMGDLVRMWYAALFLFASSHALITEGHVRVDVFYSNFTPGK